MNVAKWGNSLAIRLPAKIVAELGLKAGDKIEIVKASRERLEIDKQVAREEALRDLRKLRGLVPAGHRVTRKDSYDDY